MDYNDYLKLATDYSIKQWGFDIVRFAGEEDGWFYFSCTKEGRPHYSSMPVAIRMNSDMVFEELGWSARMKVIKMADMLHKTND